MRQAVHHTHRRAAGAAQLLLAALAALPLCGVAAPLTAPTLTRLSAGKFAYVIVEYDGRAADRAVDAVLEQRNMRSEDNAALALRRAGYDDIKRTVATAAGRNDATLVHDYANLPLAVWRVTSLRALERIESHVLVRAVHENRLLRPVSVSDLGFISQPQAAALGATGAGTSIAVIDGGLGSNYLAYADFGSCTAVATPPGTCRVAYNVDYYSGTQASTETVHGTNVSAIALGVAPAANLLMYDIFNGASATSADVLTAINSIIGVQSTYNVVAINMSLGDGSSFGAPCTGSVFASAIASAARVGITTVAAAGNSGSKAGLSDPGCAPGVVSVGAVFDNSYGAITWPAPADAGGQCTDASAPDVVTCFSQSAAYLSMLAPGTLVDAPNSSFRESGTSQATPHVAGAVAVLRARYPAESLAETLQRMQYSGVADVDPSNGVRTPRLNLAGAVQLGTSLSLSATGPTSATSGRTGKYTLKVTNGGPLNATDIVVTDTLPPGAAVTSMSAGCSVSGLVVTCVAAGLTANAAVTFTINVQWNVTGPVYDVASVRADQFNTAPPSSQTVTLGTPPDGPAVGDGPLPLWSVALLFALLALLGRSKLEHRARA